MPPKVEDKDQEAPEKTNEPKVCPLCESPLIGEAIKTGKCQCCGHKLDLSKAEQEAE